MLTDSTQINTDHKFPEKELCHKIIGCLFAAHNKYGSGHREIIYDRAFQEELERAKIPFVAKPKITLYSVTNGKRIGLFVPDYLINFAEKMLKLRRFIHTNDQKQFICDL